MLDGTRIVSSASTVHRFRELLARPGIIRSLGAHDVFSHFAHKQVVATDEMLARIRAAARARRSPEFTLCTRTDARAVNGLDDAIDRVNRCGDAGADVVFIEAPESVAELELIPKRVRRPLLANMLTGGVTPILSVTEVC